MTSPIVAELTEDMEAICEKWEASPKDRNQIYYREFAPKFVPLFADLPLNGLRGERPQFKALISVLGFSWQPVALMAAWCRPERVLVLGTPDSLALDVDGDSVREAIPAASGLPAAMFSYRRLGAAEDLDIYRTVRDFIRDYDLKPHEIAIDPTGGKKSMSIAAGLAGFLTGAWIVYVDYKEYIAEGRIPRAGSEYPRLLENPLEVFGDLEFANIKDAFARGGYDEAVGLAGILAKRLYEHREAEALGLMARGYGAWHRFDFKTAKSALSQLDDYLARFQRFGGWSWSGRVSRGLLDHLSILDSITSAMDRLENGPGLDDFSQGLPLVFNHLAAAIRTLRHGQTGAAVLLTYAALERYVDLALVFYFGLDDESPDYGRIEPDMDAFHAAGRALYGKSYKERSLAGPIGLSLGIQLLAALKSEMMPLDLAGDVTALIHHRNKCEYEHGLRPAVLKPKDVERHISTVKGILKKALAHVGVDVDQSLARYLFPKP